MCRTAAKITLTSGVFSHEEVAKDFGLLRVKTCIFELTMEYPLWAWVSFFGIVLTALAVDLGIANRHSHAPTRRETLIWSAVWVSLALLFNGFIYWMVNSHFGSSELALTKTKEFFTGYLIELSLSIDNLFVFLLIFGYFKVPITDKSVTSDKFINNAGIATINPVRIVENHGVLNFG